MGDIIGRARQETHRNSKRRSALDHVKTQAASPPLQNSLVFSRWPIVIGAGYHNHRSSRPTATSAP